MTKMTEQDIFDKVLKHIRTQKQAAVEGGLCRYRTASGLKCAVGALIPDEIYQPTMEGRRVLELLNDDYYQLNTIFDRDDKELLIDLQLSHDEILGTSERPSLPRWESCMIDIAMVHGLKYTPPE